MKLQDWSIPSPFELAAGLTLVAFMLGLLFALPDHSLFSRALQLGIFWSSGLWGLLEFTMQMALILILGHTLAISPVVDKSIGYITSRISTQTQAIMWVTVISMMTAWLNWGLGLIVGALLARKVAEHAAMNGINLNYPLVAAAGYSGLMIWHGGLSASAPLTVAQSGHFLENQIGLIPVTETIFSIGNLLLFPLILVASILFFLAKSKSKNSYSAAIKQHDAILKNKQLKRGFGGFFLGMVLLLILGYRMVIYQGNPLHLFSLNFVNLLLLGFALIAHRSLKTFAQAAEQSVSISAGIIVQFPLYAGIMGIMSESGLVNQFSDWFSSIASPTTLPLFTFISAAATNLMVPSGGGQWALQGPILMNAAADLGVSPAKVVMAMAYGDQITNMLQPFWALPLLSITGLKPKDIFPYSARLMAWISIIFILYLALF